MDEKKIMKFMVCKTDLGADKVYPQGSIVEFDAYEDWVDDLVESGHLVPCFDPEEEARLKAEAEEKAKADEEERLRVEAEEKAKADEEARLKAEADAKLKEDSGSKGKSKKGKN